MLASLAAFSPMLVARIILFSECPWTNTTVCFISLFPGIHFLWIHTDVQFKPFPAVRSISYRAIDICSLSMMIQTVMYTLFISLI